MSAFRAILRRELRALFNSGLGLLCLVLFSAVSSFIFFYKTPPWSFNDSDLTPGFFAYAPLYLMVLLPLLSLRIWADEFRGAMELLLTLPVSVTQVVLAKFAALVLFVAALLVSSLPLPLTLAYLGAPDWAAVAAGYLALLFLALLFAAVGEFFASLSDSAIGGAIGTFLVCFLLYALGLPGWLAALPPGLATVCERISVFGPFTEIATGRLSLAGSFYFFTATLFFLTLTVLRLQMYKWDNPLAPAARKRTLPVLLAFVALVLATWSVNVFFRVIQYGYIDLTANRRYTLSDQTVRTLQSLPQRVHLRACFSEQPPPDRDQALRYARALLRQYQQIAPGKLALEFYDPHHDDRLKTLADSYAIEPEVRQSEAVGEITQTACYRTVQVISGDQTELVRLNFGNIGALEEQLTVAIRSVGRTARPKVVLLEKIAGARSTGSLDEPYLPGPTEALFLSLRQTHRFDIEWLNFTDPIPAGTRLVIVHDPRELPYETAWALQEYVRAGGALLIAASSFQTPEYPEKKIWESNLPVTLPRQTTGMETLLTGWGLRFGRGLVVDRFANRRVLVPVKAASGVANPSAVYPLLLNVTGENLNPDSAFTQGHGRVFLNYATPLQIASEPPDDVTYTWLLRTSTSARLLTDDPVPIQPRAPALSLDQPGDGEHYLLAVLGRGAFPPVLTAPPPAKRPTVGTPDGKPWDGAAARPGAVLLVGSPSMLHEAWELHGLKFDPLDTDRQKRDGLQLFTLQAINRLAGAQDLLDLRAKQGVTRPLTAFADRTPELRRAAEQQLAAVVTALPVLLLLAVGLTRLKLRQRRSNRIEQTAPAPRAEDRA